MPAPPTPLVGHIKEYLQTPQSKKNISVFQQRILETVGAKNFIEGRAFFTGTPNHHDDKEHEEKIMLQKRLLETRLKQA